jgi:histidine triad (HIT) family protein
MIPPSMSCLFCDIVAKKRPSTAVFEDEDIYAFRDINPQAPTHILIIPRKHIATLNDLSDSDAELVAKVILVARDLAAQEGIAEKGYRLVWNCNALAGQSVYHIHLHIMGGRAMRWPPG